MTDPFAFLSPPGAAASGSHAPVLRTPMERAHAAAGATFAEADGWRVAEYAGEGGSAWVADVSHTGKVEARGPQEELDRAAGASAPGRASFDAGVWTLRITAERALALCPFGRVAELRDSLPGAVDMTSALAAVAIGGAAVRDVFARMSGLDVRDKSFPDGACMAGSVARCPAIVLNEGGDRFRILVGWEFGEYLWETALDAGAPLGIAPVSASVALREEVPA